MNKINWKVRFSNPVFVTQLALSIFVPILAYFGITVDQLTSWKILFDVLLDAVMNPFVIGTVFVSVWNCLNDPTTKGLKDSEEALTYEKPKGDK